LHRQIGYPRIRHRRALARRLREAAAARH
jgi:hypothetical protein